MGDRNRDSTEQRNNYFLKSLKRTKRRPESFEATFPMVMDVLENTGSIPEVAETLVVSITIASILTSTILVTLERLELGISTSTPTLQTSTVLRSIWTSCGLLFLNKPELNTRRMIRKPQSLTLAVPVTSKSSVEACYPNSQ